MFSPQVEEGLCDGKVMYHRHIQRSADEVAALQSKHEAAAKVKAERRRQQESNVRKKRLDAARKEAEKVRGRRKGGGVKEKPRKRGQEEKKKQLGKRSKSCAGRGWTRLGEGGSMG